MPSCSLFELPLWKLKSVVFFVRLRMWKASAWKKWDRRSRRSTEEWKKRSTEELNKLKKHRRKSICRVWKIQNKFSNLVISKFENFNHTNYFYRMLLSCVDSLCPSAILFYPQPLYRNKASQLSYPQLSYRKKAFQAHI